MDSTDKTPITTWEMITPAQAQKDFDERLPNRSVRWALVNRYASDMSRPEGWKPTHQGLAYDDEENRLGDGQHRLLAIIQTGKPQLMMVTRGVPRSSFPYMDGGRIRSVADVVAIEGFKNTSNLAGMIRLCHNYAGGFNFQYNPSRGIMENILKGHQEIVLINDLITTGVNVRSHVKFAGAPLGAMFALAGLKFEKEAMQFLIGIRTGEGLNRGDPRLALRNWQLARINSDKLRLRTDSSEPIFGSMIRCWNAYIEEKSLVIIKLPEAVRRSEIQIHGFDRKIWPEVPEVADKTEVARRTLLKNGQGTQFKDGNKPWNAGLIKKKPRTKIRWTHDPVEAFD
jgi:hypothetical protein